MIHWLKTLITGMAIAIPVITFGQPDTLWTRAPSENGGARDLRVIRTSDGGYAVGTTGYTGIEERGLDMQIIKTDSLGFLEWEVFFNSDRNDNPTTDYGLAIREMPDGGYVIAGKSAGDGMIVRTDSQGEMIWRQYLPRNEGHSIIWNCVVTLDSNIVVAGSDVVVKVSDANEGEVIWSHEYDNATGIEAIVLTADGGYLFGGWTGVFGAGSYDAYVAKANSEGEIEWEQAYGNENSEVCRAAISTSDGGFCLVGSSVTRDNGDIRSYIVKIDSEGELIWHHIYDEFDQGDYLRGVTETPDGGFAVVGFNAPGYEYYLLRIDSEGEPEWRTYYDNDDHDECYNVYLMEDGGYLLGGNSGSSGCWLVRTEPDPLYENAVELLDPAFPNQFSLGNVYPNPFNSTATIEFVLTSPKQVSLQLFDQTGRLIDTLVDERLTGGKHKATWRAGNRSAGVYFYRLQDEYYQQTKKLTLIK